MTATTANSMGPFAATHPEDQSLRQFLIYSVIMHTSIAVVIAVSAFIQFRSNQWGGVGGDLGGTKVTLVSPAGIPMPKEAVVSDSKAVDPTKGLHKEEPKLPDPKTDATKIPKFTKEPPLPPSPKSRTLENRTPTHDNDVNYGKGGNPDLPTGYSQTPGGGSSGTSVPGQGNADFATRYGWYIASVERRVQPNWDQMSIDAAVRFSQTLHCEISFTIMRDGYVKNVRVTQSSGNASWDNAGVRAILNSNPLPSLPVDFSGASVDVHWDFPRRGAR
jgi:TonB family protein